MRCVAHWSNAAQSSRYGAGRAATAEKSSWDIAISAEGRELPPGAGTVAPGKDVYDQQCKRVTARRRRKETRRRSSAARFARDTQAAEDLGSFWPCATTLFDYISRAMPFDRPSVMSADDVYAVTAYLLN